MGKSTRRMLDVTTISGPHSSPSDADALRAWRELLYTLEGAPRIASITILGSVPFESPQFQGRTYHFGVTFNEPVDLGVELPPDDVVGVPVPPSADLVNAVADEVMRRLTEGWSSGVKAMMVVRDE